MRCFVLFVMMAFAPVCAQSPAANKAKLTKEIKVLSNRSALLKMAAQEDKVLGMKSMLALRQTVEAAMKAKNKGDEEQAVELLQEAQGDLEKHYMAIGAAQEWAEAKNETDHTLAMLKKVNKGGTVNNAEMKLVTNLLKKLEPLKEVQAKANLIAEEAAEEADEMFEQAEEEAEEEDGGDGDGDGEEMPMEEVPDEEEIPNAPPAGFGKGKGKGKGQGKAAFLMERRSGTPAASVFSIGVIAAGLVVASAVALTVRRRFEAASSADSGHYVSIE